MYFKKISLNLLLFNIETDLTLLNLKYSQLSDVYNFVVYLFQKDFSKFVQEKLS